MSTRSWTEGLVGLGSWEREDRSEARWLGDRKMFKARLKEEGTTLVTDLFKVSEKKEGEEAEWDSRPNEGQIRTRHRIPILCRGGLQHLISLSGHLSSPPRPGLHIRSIIEGLLITLSQGGMPLLDLEK